MSGRIWELLLILLIILVLFGAGRLPRVMSDIGRSLRSLREGFADAGTDEENNTKNKKSDPTNKRKGK